LHLKLALDTLKNPIPEVPSVRASSVSTESLPVFSTERGVDKENREFVDDEQEGHADDVYEDEDEGDDEHHEKATEMQDHMQDLLKDLGMFRRKIGDDMFRRKIGDDKSRFLQPLMERINR
ncbi:hypothetical protein V498_07978, partial [Pseudogymnoascus sp. VKM F-4517 (FW-2822)]